MSASIDLPEMRERIIRWSVDDYERLGDLGVIEKRAELIRGIIVRKMPKSPLHVYLTELIADLCREQLRSGYFIRQESPLRVADDSEPEPDVFVVRGSRSDYKASHPRTADLVVEIAVSSATWDRQNASLYAEAEVSEYWIVDCGKRTVEVYRRPESGVYLEIQVYAEGEALVCQSIPGLQVSTVGWFD